jgi:hypothetical protein
MAFQICRDTGAARHPSRENIEEHPKTEDDGGSSLIVDASYGKTPYCARARSLPCTNRTKYVDPNVPCFPSGAPRSLYVPTQIEFLQTTGYVLILFGWAHTFV